MPETTLQLSSVSDRFKRQLDQPNNHFMIVSGQYGTGKTFFLKEFFRIQKQDFQAIFISPLKYQVNSTESIFELIKLDIIQAMFKMGLATFEELDPDKPKDLDAIVANKSQATLEYYLRMLPKLGPFSSATPGTTERMLETLYGGESLEEAAMVSLHRSPELRMSLFIESMTGKQGHGWEMDLVTMAINEVITDWRHKDGDDRQWILVIDDFDRLDPEHAFRILNVFSAHQDDEEDWWEEANEEIEEGVETEDGATSETQMVKAKRIPFKFFFDKVILVCDYNRLRNLYEFRHGKQANFKGYIDKFLSQKVFDFRQVDTIEHFLFSLFDFPLNPGDKIIIHALIKKMFEEGVINVRQLAKLKGFTPLDGEMVLGELHLIRHHPAQIIKLKHAPLVKFLSFLSSLVGSYREMKAVVSHTGGMISDLSFEDSLEIAHSLFLTYIGLLPKGGKILDENGKEVALIWFNCSNPIHTPWRIIPRVKLPARKVLNGNEKGIPGWKFVISYGHYETGYYWQPTGHHNETIIELDIVFRNLLGLAEKSPHAAVLIPTFNSGMQS